MAEETTTTTTATPTTPTPATPAPAPRKRSVGAVIGSLIGTFVLAAACGVGGWVACELWPKSDPMAEAMAQQAAAAAQEAPTVGVVTCENRPYNPPERFVAHAEAIQEVDLLPQVDGYVKEIKFKEGDIVKQGAVLYILDDERYQAIANQRRADLGAAKADLEAAKAETRRAERYWERMQKVDARGITQKERDDAQAGAEKAKAAEERAKASVIQAEAYLKTAEYDLKRTKVYAPIAGQIGKTTAHIGDYVAPSKGALAHIVQVDPIRVSFPLTDRAYVTWRTAQKNGKSLDLRMRLLMADDSVYSQVGTWDFDDNQMSRETATILMRLSFPNPDRLLVPNSFVTLLADYKTAPRVPCVPQQAVIDLPGGDRGVYVVDAHDVVSQRIIEAGEMYEGWVSIKKGVKAGERVVVSGTSKLAMLLVTSKRGNRPAKVRIEKPTDNDDLNPNYKRTVD